MVYFDVCAVIIMIIMAVSLYMRRLSADKPLKIFISFMTLVLFTSFCDIGSIMLDSKAGTLSPAVNGIRYICHFLYLTTRSFHTPVYIIYLVSLTDTWHNLRKDKLKMSIMIVPVTIVTFMMLLNFFVPTMFWIDAETDKYTRGSFFFLLYIGAAIYFLFGFYYIWKFRNYFSKDKLFAVYAIFVFTIAAVLFQLINPGMQIEMLATSLSLLLITIIIERPEESVDSTTGLRNFTAYKNDIKRDFANDKHVKVIIVNIENYNSIMEIAGYDSSEDILKDIATRLNALKKEMKSNADIYRLDSGRFRVVLSGKDAELAEEAAEIINSHFRQNLRFNQLDLNFITYVCIVRCPEDVCDYEALRSFGNNLSKNVPYTGNVITAAELAQKKSFTLANDIDNIIDNALANNLFQVYYQPIYSVKEKKFVSAEALLRLIDDKHGFIPPDVFIGAAEKNGTIHRIGDLVLEQVCRFISGPHFTRLGLEYIEVNLSVAQCMQADLAEKVLSILNKYKVKPSQINLEITETAASYAQNVMTSNINKLISSGISISLDDYGTGYSNIKSVASLPLSIVKFDKTFVRELENPRMWIVLSNTVRMIKAMNISIVVEGVETQEIVNKFSDLQCDYIQGYFFSKPIPEQAFVEFMEKHCVNE